MKQWFIESTKGSMYVDLIQAFPMSLKIRVSHHGKEALVRFLSKKDYISAKEGMPVEVEIIIPNKGKHFAKIYFKNIIGVTI